ncbi:MAG: MBL fold metallo-hydrolase [Spirochaetales bacterium]|nr:MBL fold metallo-hydrolase [Spirochaetales bacterium]
MIIKTLVLGPLQTNTYIVGCEDTNEAVIIDPSGEADKIIREISNLNLVVKYILNTHTHFDHIGGNAELVEYFKAKLLMHRDAVSMLKDSGGASAFGMDVPPSPEPDGFLEHNDKIKFGSHCFEVFYTPGHAPGHVVFYEPNNKALFAGDVLFWGSIGRSDLDGGDHDLLVKCIKDYLLTLPEDTVVYSGHGPVTNIGQEKRNNPYLQD